MQYETISGHNTIICLESSGNGLPQINIYVKKSLQSKQPRDLVKGLVVDVGGHCVASQVGQVESSSHGNKAGGHFQDGQ